MKLEAFFPRVLISAAGAPRSLVMQALVDTAIEFCEQTNTVRVVSDPIDLVADQANYDLDIPTGCTLSRVLDAWYGPKAAPHGRPSRVETDAAGTLTISPVPSADQAATLTVEFSTKPLRSATAIDDLLYQDYVEGIVGGAVMRLASIPDQPFSSPTNAALGSAQLLKALSAARYEAHKKRVRHDTRVTPRPFA